MSLASSHAYFLILSVAVGPLLLTSASEGAEPTTAPRLQNGDVPIGSLGQPLGTYLKVEGVRGEGFKAGVSSLIVDTVDGRKLKTPVRIWVDNLALPAGKRCEIKGYETVQMIGQPPARGAAEEEAGRDAILPQAGWQIRLSFVALRVVAPADLKIQVERQ